MSLPSRASLRLILGALCAALLAAEAPTPKAEKPPSAKGKDSAPDPKPPAAEEGEGGEAETPEPPKKPDPVAVLKEIEAAEKPILAKLEALAAPGSASLIARRLQAPLGAARSKAYLAMYKEPNPANFYATKDPGMDGYGYDTAKTVQALAMEVLAVFKDGFLRDAEAKKAYDEAAAALEALSSRREAAGLPGLEKGAEAYLALCRQRVSEAMTPSADRAVLQQNATAGAALEPLELAAFREYNLYRVAMGFKAIRLDLRLFKAAKGHSEEMARLNYFSHLSPTKDLKDVDNRTARAGFPSGTVSECIAKAWDKRKDEPFTPIEEWISSPPHHKGMLGPHEVFGLGTALAGAPAKPAGKAEPAAPGDEPPAADDPPKTKGAKDKGKAKAKGAKAARYWTLVMGSLTPPKRIGLPPGTKVIIVPGKRR